MTVKAVVQRQCQRLVDEAADRVLPVRPPEGWLRTVRKALGMSVYCGPVLRHPAELIQAANDRSVVTV